MSSQGQRFRRRALRRGYKVDEVDSFLDRVEATLAGEPIGPPVGAQEVHDVVFRVRFGGYDEWQVDLHLDRVERQLAELEDRGGRAPAPDPMRDSMRGGLSAVAGMGGAGMGGSGMGGGGGMGGGMGPGLSSGRIAPPTERLPAPMRDDPRMQDPRMQDPRMQDPRMQQDPRMDPRLQQDPRMDPRLQQDPRMQDPRQMPQRQQPQLPPGPSPMQQPDPYGRYDEPQGYGQQPPQQPPMPQRGLPPGRDAGYDTGSYDKGGYDTGSYDTGSFNTGSFEPQGGYDGFEAGRHGKTDMTAEIRMPQREQDMRGGYGAPPMSGPPMSNAPVSNAPMSGAGGYGPQQPQLPPLMGEPGGELHRVDALRRTFQPRRFGSGYDPMQVDRLFEGILQAMTGRGPMPVPENELDMLQFGLVPGGYFEAEVDAALREVKDILLRHR